MKEVEEEEDEKYFKDYVKPQSFCSTHTELHPKPRISKEAVINTSVMAITCSKIVDHTKR